MFTCVILSVKMYAILLAFILLPHFKFNQLRAADLSLDRDIFDSLAITLVGALYL
jgi:hypothetical protein